MYFREGKYFTHWKDQLIYESQNDFFVNSNDIKIESDFYQG